MTLPKEWQQEAENKAGDTLDNTTFEHNGDWQRALESAEYEYVNGATAYKQAVEKMIDGELSKCALANLMLTDNAGR
jgi:hypothetical protein